MILICRFRRSLVTAQTNRFALRLARDSATEGILWRPRAFRRNGTLVVLRFGGHTEGQRAAAQSRSQYLLNRSSPRRIRPVADLRGLNNGVAPERLRRNRKRLARE
jgi:hypothetical protein